MARIDCGRHFNQLGRLLQDRWRAKNHDTAVFAALAATALAELPPTGITPSQLLRFGRRTAELPPQLDLGDDSVELTLCLFLSQRFSIKALIRPSEATAIHQHGFVGASYLLAGAAVHSRYRFSADDRVNARLVFGQLDHQAVELVGAGHIRRIDEGDRLIHALFPVGGPSVAVVVASNDLAGVTPYTYEVPGLARNFDDPDPRTTVLTRIFGLLDQYDPAACTTALQESVVHAEFDKALAALEHASESDVGQEVLAALIERARTRHGERAARILPLLAERQRRRTLEELETDALDPAESLMRALLLSVASQESACRLFREHHPHRDPGGVIASLAAAKTPRSLTSAALGGLA
jgi:hypothetical protein